ncbi:tRNA (adenosine(37)-N6)-threonylcarbamoyltransferase complex dimerization subunit type 1 TsaB [Brevibacterium daeguense]|uniref:tRNA (Adenosine(37)-N6)-threonylcarbamoyltransferase complex dimerization subunit type 1 TsaB n=1 Tax=Brevibacterium daeguense TaxID=909936 RepID=A0ABP8EG34_9MICO|nr:tRNA (adenosine(37)-N6)-threonylcarbamoyltransferase complex dimerization subunit type 1 TsaB [Brevibacterium daeguense]
MIILALDTSAAASAALLDDDIVLADWTEFSVRKHAEHLGPALAELLAGQPAPQLAVVGVGPGPFTGLRAGIATAIGYGLGRDIPVHGLPSHHGLALRAFEADPTGEVVVATDARRKEVYWTRYSGLDSAGVPVVAAGPEVSAPAALGAQRARRYGRGFALYPELLGAPVGDEPADLETTAADLGRVAVRMLTAGRELLPTTPLYLRAPDAKPAAPTTTSLR